MNWNIANRSFITRVPHTAEAKERLPKGSLVAG
jgi:hypothetical protein